MTVSSASARSHSRTLCAGLLAANSLRLVGGLGNVRDYWSELLSTRVFTSQAAQTGHCLCMQVVRDAGHAAVAAVSY